MRIFSDLIWAVVPVKDFDAAKQRLADVLTPADRRALVRAMLHDVLTALVRVSALDRIVVVTREAEAYEMARQMGLEVLTEPKNEGQTSAILRALREAERHRAHAVLALPGDIPLLDPTDVEAILHAARAADLVLVPSRDGRGTNALWLRVPSPLPLRFGPNSFPFHRRMAEERNLRLTLLMLPHVALDVDTPEDLKTLASTLRRAPGRTTSALLETWQWLAPCR